MAFGKPIVLILCTGNSCRSQMAEGFLRHYQGDKYDVHSAGTEPKEAVHPMAITVMSEVAIDISDHKPKASRDYLGYLPVLHLIIVCNKAYQTCPRVWPGTYSRAFMPFDDPAEAEGTEQEKLEVFRRVRDEIGLAMRDWVPVLPNVRTAGT